MKVRARFKYRECNLPRGESGGYPMYFTQSECLGWLCCLAWQTFGSSSNGTDTLQWSKVQWAPGKQRKMCWAQTQRWSQPSGHVSIGYQKKNFSTASRCSTKCGQSVFCAHRVFVLVAQQLFNNHMLFFVFPLPQVEPHQALLFRFNWLSLSATVWLPSACSQWRTWEAASRQWCTLCTWELNRAFWCKIW